MKQPDTERPFPVSKDVLDTVNSVTWFMADGLWMLGQHQMALAFIAPTALTGLLLLYVEKRLSVVCINVAINCWIWMNAWWVVFDMSPAPHYRILSQIFFILGMLAILAAVITSGNVRETFSHFRRFRGLK